MEEKKYCKDCEFWQRLGMDYAVERGECNVKPPTPLWNPENREFENRTPVTDSYRKSCKYFK